MVFCFGSGDKMNDLIINLFGIDRSRALEIMKVVAGIPSNKAMAWIRENLECEEERNFAMLYVGFSLGKRHPL